MEQIEFNLLEEPWIRVMKKDCTVEECSLTQVLLNSHEYMRLSGELPTQDVAILRLLLAILHTVFYRVNTDGEEDPIEDEKQALGRWRDLWEARHLPEKPIRDYLEHWKERFWLFHPEHPFYQVPAAEIGTKYSAAKLNGELAESGNKIRLFPVRAGKGKESLGYAEAARWLLYLNGFDDTSAKPKTKGLPSPGAGWMGKLGLIWAQGDNLFETLMLNLVFLNGDREIWNEPKPVWEREKPKDTERTEIAMPDNQAELLTLQSRRLLLERGEDNVIGYRLLGGDFFSKINAIAEQMTMWNRIKGKKNEPPYNQPKRLNPDRKVWRDFYAITGAGEECRAPGTVTWITTLQSKRILNRNRIIQFRVAGVQYGDKDFFVEDILSDHLDFHTDLLENVGKLWIGTIQSQIEKTEKAAWLLGELAKQIFRAEGGQPDCNAEKARTHQAAQDFYAAVDLPFRAWLCSIDPQLGDDEDQRKDMQNQWGQEAFRIALKKGQQMVKDAGTGAYVGRWIVNGETNKAEFYSSSAAFNQFKREIYICFDIPIHKKEAADE